MGHVFPTSLCSSMWKSLIAQIFHGTIYWDYFKLLEAKYICLYLFYLINEFTCLWKENSSIFFSTQKEMIYTPWRLWYSRELTSIRWSFIFFTKQQWDSLVTERSPEERKGWLFSCLTTNWTHIYLPSGPITAHPLEQGATENTEEKPGTSESDRLNPIPSSSWPTLHSRPRYPRLQVATRMKLLILTSNELTLYKN